MGHLPPMVNPSMLLTASFTASMDYLTEIDLRESWLLSDGLESLCSTLASDFIGDSLYDDSTLDSSFYYLFSSYLCLGSLITSFFSIISLGILSGSSVVRTDSFSTFFLRPKDGFAPRLGFVPNVGFFGGCLVILTSSG